MSSNPKTDDASGKGMWNVSKDNAFVAILVTVIGWLASQFILQYNEFKNERIKKQTDYYFELMSAATEYMTTAYPIIEKPRDIDSIKIDRDKTRQALDRYEILYRSKNPYLLNQPFGNCFDKLLQRMNGTFFRINYDIASETKNHTEAERKIFADNYIHDRTTLQAIIDEAGRKLRDYHVSQKSFPSFLFGNFSHRNGTCS